MTATLENLTVQHEEDCVAQMARDGWLAGPCSCGHPVNHDRQCSSNIEPTAKPCTCGALAVGPNRSDDE